jgi:hypothetical protein
MGFECRSKQDARLGRLHKVEGGALTGPGGEGGRGINKKAMNEVDAGRGGDMAAVIVIEDDVSENEEIGVRKVDQGARGGESGDCGRGGAVVRVSDIGGGGSRSEDPRRGAFSK